MAARIETSASQILYLRRRAETTSRALSLALRLTSTTTNSLLTPPASSGLSTACPANP
jgi:hypothetical protein